MSDYKGTSYVKEFEKEYGKDLINSFEKVKSGLSNLSTNKVKTGKMEELTEKLEQRYKEVRDNSSDNPREINLPFKNQKERNYQLARLKVTFFLILMIFLATQEYLMYWYFYYEEVPFNERLELLILSSRMKIDDARLEKTSILIRFI